VASNERPRIADAAFVVRGGLLADYADAVRSAETAEVAIEEQLYGLSVECFEVHSEDEALRACTRPHPRVRMSTAQRIRDAGLDVLPTLDEPHATMLVPQPLDADAWELLQRLFDPAIENPYRVRRR
jgi:Ethanolamine utilization protein EutJ (predicted chaperonin)